MIFRGFDKDRELCNFDIFPKVVVEGKKTKICIRTLGCALRFSHKEQYTVKICPIECGNPRYYPAAGGYIRELPMKAEPEAGPDALSFEYAFEKEGQYSVKVFSADKRQLVRLFVYCVAEDLAGRYPLRGDCHIHSCFSDGAQFPWVAAANYRRRGYDFMTITDHNRYYPSLRTMEFYKDVPTGLCIVPGEEVQLGDVDDMKVQIHIVNFGGEYSVNALTEGNSHTDVGDDPSVRSLYGVCPDFMYIGEYEEMMRRLTAEEEKRGLPEGVDAFPVAYCRFVFSQIKAAGGLGIFAHPYDYGDTFYVSRSLTDYIVNERMFDAFEVIGGGTDFEKNGFQTARYYSDRARGIRYPVVGDTDSHSSYEYFDESMTGSTIIFSPENERKALIDSVKNFYSVALDTSQPEFRFIGEERLIRYSTFLIRNYFPIHDDLCFEEGQAMKQYAVGTEEEKEEALALLRCISGRVERMRKKYFGF